MENKEPLTYAEKNRLLYFEQKKTLDLFLERNAISKAQYDKSLHDLTVKMGMAELNTPQHLLCNQMGHAHIHVTQLYYLAVTKGGVDVLQNNSSLL